MAVLCLSLFTTITAQRQSFELHEDWNSFVIQSPNPDAVLNDTVQLNLPHNWDDYYGYRQLTHGNLHGSALYTKHFVAPEKQEGKSYFIRFEGVGTYAVIKLNNKDLGRHLGGRVTFTIDVSDCLNYGTDNLLEVKVEHPHMISDMPCVCGGCSSEWGFSEGSQPFGIYRPVVFEVTDEVRIEPFGVHIWNDDQAKKVFIDTEIRNYSGQEQQLLLENRFNTHKGKKVFALKEEFTLAPGATVTIRQEAGIEDPVLWSTENPYLYKLVTSIRQGKKKRDVLETPFGIRTISWPVKRNDDDGRFFLNGKPVFLNGTCEYEHLLGQGHAFSPEQVESRVKQMLNAGFNAFRDAHQPHHLDYQKYWDQHGILFWTQLSAHIWYDTPVFRENFKTQLRQWVKERRNSPSVVLWGLQNESMLPRDFAEECTAIIREMDPTALNMRAVTTCNGGEGTDWNVIQNWSGTYSGNPERYDEELALPNQLLNGEYGAWRTLDLHEEPGPFKQDGIYSEERFCQLMEMKINLAEKARDKVCGQFQWIFNSHDNPGRRQPDEAYRLIDRVGPVNYKGLITPWEEPLDAYYMYRSNYVSADTEPMVYIASHTWPDRFEAPGNATIQVYSNCDSVQLYNDAGKQAYLGTEVHQGIKGTHFAFENIRVAYNVLRAVAYRAGKAVAEDLIVLNNLEKSPSFDLLYKKDKSLTKGKSSYHYIYRINCGGDEYVDSFGQVWAKDDTSFSRSWAQDFDGLNPYQASQRVSYDPVKGSRDWSLFGHFRYGRHKLAYRFPLPDGKYRMELYFVEPWHGTGAGKGSDFAGLRLFDVSVNGKILLNDLDIWSEAGHDVALKKTFNVDVQGGYLNIEFPEVKAGQALISAIA
ncbi:MAG: malectin domain-containing carbohydrate-binding protein, partial [Bacteroidales bacterium]